MSHLSEVSPCVPLIQTTVWEQSTPHNLLPDSELSFLSPLNYGPHNEPVAHDIRISHRLVLKVGHADHFRSLQLGKHPKSFADVFSPQIGTLRTGRAQCL